MMLRKKKDYRIRRMRMMIYKIQITMIIINQIDRLLRLMLMKKNGIKSVHEYRNDWLLVNHQREMSGEYI
jgi:hypothetical protein